MDTRATDDVHVHRANIWEVFRQRLQLLREGRSAFPIVNVVGIAGIGKSYIARQLFEQYGQDTPTVLIEIQPNRRFSVNRSPDAAQPSKLSSIVNVMQQIPALSTQLPLPENYTSQDASEILLSLANFEQSKLAGDIVVIIDGADDFRYWRWLQEAVVKPLVEADHCLIVLTSHLELFWDFWELHEKSEVYQLPTFDTNEIGLFLAQSGLGNFAPLASDILDFTQGYPLAVHHFVRQLYSPDEAATLPPEEATRLLNTFSPETRDMLLRVGVIRLAEVDLILEVSRKLGDQSIRRQQVIQALSELAHAESGPMEASSSADSAFLLADLPGLPKRFAPRLRHAVRTQLGDKDNLRLCRTLADLYYDRTNEQPKTRAYAFLEWLYFSVPLLLHGNQHDRAEWRNKLQTLAQRITTVQQEDKSTATPLIFVLFYRDRELITQIMAANLAGLNVEAEVRQVIRSLATQVDRMRDERLEVLNSIPLESYLDRSCNDVFRDLHTRLPARLVPQRLKEQNLFVNDIRQLFNERGSLELDSLRRSVSIVTKLPPGEIDKVVRVLGVRGLIESESIDEKRIYRFHPYLTGLAKLGDDKVNRKACLTLTTNSPQ